MYHLRQGQSRRTGDDRLPALRRHPGYRIRLRLYPFLFPKTSAAGTEGPDHVALPGAAAGGGPWNPRAPAGGRFPAVPGGRPGKSAGPPGTVDQGRRPEPDRLPEGPGFRHGRDQGIRGRQDHHRLFLHGQRRQLPGRQRGGRGTFHLHLCPVPGAPGQGGAADDVRRHGDPGGRKL